MTVFTPMDAILVSGIMCLPMFVLWFTEWLEESLRWQR